MGVKLGQKWAVKDGNLLASNQVGSRFFNKEFDFSRASNGTYVDRDGLLKTAELYNKLSYSEDFTQAYWVKFATGLTITPNAIISPFGVQNASKLVSGSTNAQQAIYRSIAVTNSTLSVYAKKAEFTTICLKLGGAQISVFNLDDGTIGYNTNVTPSIEDVGNGWYRCSINYSGASTYAWISISSGNTQGDEVSGVYIFGAQLVEGTQRDYQYTNGRQGLPRISFEDGVGHLLLEPQRSNLLLQSNSFDTTWANISANLTSGQSGIYGSNNAWEIERTATGARVQQSVSISGINTFSLYAKAGTLNWIQIINTSSPFEGAFFDLQNGVVGTIDSDTLDASITSVGNGWYRIYFSLNFSGTTNFRISPADADNDKSGTSGSIYIQHAQLEAGSYPTSIIETTTTQITRLADVCNNSGSAQDFNSEEGVLYAEISALSDDLTWRFITINDGTSNNAVSIAFQDISKVIRTGLRLGNVQEVSLSYNFTEISDYYKIAFKYKENDFALWINGVEVATDLSGSVFSPNTLNTLNFDYGSGSLDFYGKVRNLQVFTEALSDAELQQLTSI